MAKLTVFNFISLNGFYKGTQEDISWHRHETDEIEEGKHAAQSLQADNILLFGRVTYEMMAAYWPTPLAAQNNPTVAEGMNKAEKIVVSKTLQQASWSNTRVLNSHILEAIRALKQRSDKNITILGSGSIVSWLTRERLIDAYQFMIDPVVLATGGTIFQGIDHQLNLRLTNSKIFKSGVVMVDYEPM